MNIRRNEAVLATAHLREGRIIAPAFVGAGALSAWAVSLIAALSLPMPMDTSVFAVLGAVAGLATAPKFMAYRFTKAIANARAPSQYKSYPNIYSDELKKHYRSYREKNRIKGQSLNLLLRKPLEILVSSEEVPGGYKTRHEAVKIVGSGITVVQYNTPSELTLWKEAVANAMELK